ncbi:MAG: hypothetical protein HQK75_10620 [Candidatus Magnetomorum sp.]|nr:hypothetical protein [Candidatus Magnetomorum sp.]
MKKLISIICVSIFMMMSSAWAKQVVDSKKAKFNKTYWSYKILNNERQLEPEPYELDQYEYLYNGQSVIPTVFAYHCNNHDPDIQNCGAFTVPYGNNLHTDVHFTHSWFQIMNTSAHTFNTEESQLIIKVYGKNGQLTIVNGGPDWYNNGIVDVLHPELAGTDGFTPNESIFFYFGDWMHDRTDDTNPPYSARLIVQTKVVSTGKTVDIKLTFHSGWEEIIEDDDGQRFAKGGTLIDKEILQLQPAEVTVQSMDKTIQPTDLQLTFDSGNDGIKDYWDPDDDN